MKDFKPANKSSGPTYHQDSKPIQNKKGPTYGGLAKDSLAPKSIIEQAREGLAKQRGEEYRPGSNYPGGAKDSLIQRSLQEQAKYGALQKKNAESTSDSKSKMSPSIQAKMENSFGTDFSNVNIHQGDSATAMNALAYTQGNDIHFAPGQYNPESQSGQELLGHELTHVVQQRSDSIQPTTQLKGVGVNDDWELEKEADENGKKAAEGNRVINVSSVPQNPIQRKKTYEENVLDKVEQYSGYIKEASEKYSIDESQIKALISVESEGISDASSGAAYGLMQITRSTWEGTINHKLFPELKSYDFDNYWKNSRINIFVGAATFKLKTNSVGIDSRDENFAEIAIAAYNAGEGTIKKAIVYAKAGGSKNPNADCLKAEYLKPAIVDTEIYSYYYTGKGKIYNTSKSIEEAVDLKFNEISKYPNKVKKYLNLQSNNSDELIVAGNLPNNIYVVKSGDTINSISQLFNISPDALKEANPSFVKKWGEGYNIGEKLIIPSNLTNAAIVDGNEIKNVNSVAPEVNTSIKFIGKPENYYTVRNGDTVKSISILFGISESVIKEANPNYIKSWGIGYNAGETILLPGINVKSKLNSQPIKVENKNKQEIIVSVKQIIDKKLDEYQKSLIDMVSLGKSLIPYGNSNGNDIINLINKLPVYHRDNLCYVIASNCNDAQLSKIDKNLLKVMESNLDSYFTFSFSENSNQVVRIRKALSINKNEQNKGTSTDVSNSSKENKQISNISSVDRPSYENIESVYGTVGDQKNLKKITLPFKLIYGTSPVTSAMVHVKVADSLVSALSEVLSHYGKEKIETLRINANYGGLYNQRLMRGSSSKWSTHSWGIAIDLNHSENQLKWGSDKALFAKPEYQALLDIMEKHGWYNQGRYMNNDYMHFQAVKY